MLLSSNSTGCYNQCTNFLLQSTTSCANFYQMQMHCSSVIHNAEVSFQTAFAVCVCRREEIAAGGGHLQKECGWVGGSCRTNNGLRTLGGRAVNLDFQLDGARLNFSIRSTHCASTDGHDGTFRQQERGKIAHPREKEINLKLLAGFPPKLHLSVQLCVRPTVNHQRTLHHTYMQYTTSLAECWSHVAQT